MGKRCHEANCPYCFRYDTKVSDLKRMPELPDPIEYDADLRADEDRVVDYHMADQNEREDDCVTCTWCWPARELFEMKQVHGFFPRACEDGYSTGCRFIRPGAGLIRPCE